MADMNAIAERAESATTVLYEGRPDGVKYTPKEIADAQNESKAEAHRYKVVNPKFLQVAIDTIEQYKQGILPRDSHPSIQEVLTNLSEVKSTLENQFHERGAHAAAREKVLLIANKLSRKAGEAQIDGSKLRAGFEPSDHRSVKAANLVLAYTKYYSTAAALLEQTVANEVPYLAKFIAEHGQAAAWAGEHFLNNSDIQVRQKALAGLPPEVKDAFAKLTEASPYHNGIV